MRPRSGSVPLLLFLLLTISVTGRSVHRNDAPPAFFVDRPPRYQYALQGDWSRPGIHQFFDGSAAECVIVLTVAECDEIFNMEYRALNGSVLVRRKPGGVTQEGWLPAAQRMALQVPLHPDRMQIDDWPALHGIGTALGQAIETDRQLNGDFGHVEALMRVKGIATGRLKKFRRYFENDNAM